MEKIRKSDAEWREELSPAEYQVLRQAGIVGSERRGLWAYYYVIPDALEEFSAWLS